MCCSPDGFGWSSTFQLLRRSVRGPSRGILSIDPCECGVDEGNGGEDGRKKIEREKKICEKGKPDQGVSTQRMNLQRGEDMGLRLVVMIISCKVRCGLRAAQADSRYCWGGNLSRSSRAEQLALRGRGGMGGAAHVDAGWCHGEDVRRCAASNLLAVRSETAPAWVPAALGRLVGRVGEAKLDPPRDRSQDKVEVAPSWAGFQRRRFLAASRWSAFGCFKVVFCRPSSETGPSFQNYGLQLGIGPKIHLIVLPGAIPSHLCAAGFSSPSRSTAGRWGRSSQHE